MKSEPGNSSGRLLGLSQPNRFMLRSLVELLPIGHQIKDTMYSWMWVPAQDAYWLR